MSVPVLELELAQEPVLAQELVLVLVLVPG